MRFVSAALRGAGRIGAVAIAAVPTLLRDLVGIAGAGSVVYGIWQIYIPAAYIAGGLMLTGAALLLARRASPQSQDNA
jgi:small neutral amino acid transporter SnatA (MarC family)